MFLRTQSLGASLEFLFLAEQKIVSKLNYFWPQSIVNSSVARSFGLVDVHGHSAAVILGKLFLSDSERQGIGASFEIFIPSRTAEF